MGELPFLPHTRLHDNVSNALPLAIRKEISHTVEAMLALCGLQPAVIESVTGLALFVRTLKTASASRGKLCLDPHGFIDEWYWVESQLLRYPGPLCDPNTPAQSLQVNIAEGSPTGEFGKAPTIKTLHMPAPLNVEPAPTENILEPVVRLASVLYIEALIPDDPRTLNGYAVLLTLMSKTMADVMGRLRRRGAVENGRFDDGLLEIAAMRPVMIWAALVAYVVAWLGEREVHWGSVRYERSVYRDCLLYFIGPEPGDVDRLSDSDLAFCEILDLQGLLRKRLDTRELLQAIIGDHVDGLN